MDCSVVRRDSLTGTYWTDVTDELCEEPFVASVPFVSSIVCVHRHPTINVSRMIGRLLQYRFPHHISQHHRRR
jgi:hypothetical protein